MFLAIGVHRDKVVGVHDRVYETVQHDGQVDVSIISLVQIQPIELQKQNKNTHRGTYN